ncbi:hypothetical protein J6590_007335 [Homalodisca vitripennis]|nr:hypothetical protein J6590_007335 [Homalodisca vitripennis]
MRTLNFCRPTVRTRVDACTKRASPFLVKTRAHQHSLAFKCYIFRTHSRITKAGIASVVSRYRTVYYPIKVPVLDAYWLPIHVKALGHVSLSGSERIEHVSNQLEVELHVPFFIHSDSREIITSNRYWTTLSFSAYKGS